MITAYTPEQIEAAQERMRAKRPKEPDPVNIEPLMQLGADQFFTYSGQMLRLPPISFRDGMRLNQLWIRMAKLSNVDELDEKTIAECSALFHEVVTLLGRLVRPVGWIRAIAWRCGFRRNPFGNATEREVPALVGFFSTCRTNTPVRLSHTQRTTS